MRALRYSVGVCTLGHVLVADAGEGLCAVLLGDSPESLLAELGGRFAGETPVAAGSQAALAEVIASIEDPARAWSSPIAPRGTAFQLRVWEALRRLRVGTTTTYSALATALNLPATAVRAVAGACGANPLAVVVPCHRVVRQDGGLAGYRWGLERKRMLLERELQATGGSQQLSLLG